MRESIELLKKDASVSGFVAGFIITLVGMTSSAVLVFQAARSAGIDAAGASSWLGSLCFSMGLLSVILSVRHKAPVLVAWSSAGAALLITGLNGVSISDTIGAFIFSAFLIFLSGVTGIFEKLMNRIPMALASALLAGILLHFSLDAFSSFKGQPLLIGAMFFTYILAKRFAPRLAMLFVLIVGVLIAAWGNLLHLEEIKIATTQWHFQTPTFSFPVLLSIGLPLYIVTMASQNLAGITVMRTNGFQVPISPLLTWTGLVNILVAPFGGFTLNLAAITAAIAMGPESHPETNKRYFAGVISGLFYILIGVMAATVTSLFAALPNEMVMGIAGFALLTTIANCLQGALANESQKDAAFITFAITASGLTIFGIGSAFWGLVAGAVAQGVLSLRFQKKIK